MSAEARRLLRYLMDCPHQAPRIEDIATFLRLSKTAIRRALMELEASGDIQIGREEE